MLRKVIAAALVSSVALSAAGGAAAEEAAAAPVEPFSHVSCRGRPNEVRVTIDNVKKNAGLITAELYRNEPDNFLKKAGREFRVRFAAKAPVTQFCVTAPAEGKFAVVAYHDRNANLKFDKNPFGFPAEPFGVSQNPTIRLAPPPIEETLFEVGKTGSAIEIKLRD
jgi:uncharacterized protein (DUF2141 family)